MLPPFPPLNQHNYFVGFWSQVSTTALGSLTQTLAHFFQCFWYNRNIGTNRTFYICFALSNNNFACFFDRFVHFGEKVECHCEAPNCQGYLGNQIKNPTQNALTIKDEQEKSREHSPIQHGSSVSILHSMSHLLPWTNPNCIEVSFNLRSKSKITRICWVGKRKRTSLVASYNKHANVGEWSSCCGYLIANPLELLLKQQA